MGKRNSQISRNILTIKSKIKIAYQRSRPEKRTAFLLQFNR